MMSTIFESVLENAEKEPDFFLQGALQDVLPSIFLHCSLLDVDRFEVALAKKGIEPIERFYQQLHKKYFPHIPCPENHTHKQHFKETLLSILDNLKKLYKVNISKVAFYEAARGNVKFLLKEDNSFSDEQKEWLWAIHYSYGTEDIMVSYAKVLDINASPDCTYAMLEKPAFILSERKEYAAFESLLRQYFKKDWFDVRERNRLFLNVVDNKWLYLMRFMIEYFEEMITPQIRKEALERSVKSRSKEIVELLLKTYGPVLSERELSIFYQANQVQDLECMLLFLRYCKKRLSAHAKKEIFFCAKELNCLEVVEFILKEYGEEIGPEIKRIALLTAVHDKKVDLFKMLLQYCSQGVTAAHRKAMLSRAIEDNRLDLVEIIVKYYAKEFMEEDQNSIICCMLNLCYRYHSDGNILSDVIISLFKQCDHAIFETHKISFFLVACSFNYLEVVAFFISEEKELLAEIKQWAFYEAARKGNAKLVSFFLEHPEAGFSKKEKQRALHQASRHGYTEVAELISSHLTAHREKQVKTLKGPFAALDFSKRQQEVLSQVEALEDAVSALQPQRYKR